MLLHGGGLLGVVLNKRYGSSVQGSFGPLFSQYPPPPPQQQQPGPAGEASGSGGAGPAPAPAGSPGGPLAQGRALQLFSWRGGFQRVGPELPEPLWVAWEPEVGLLLLLLPGGVRASVLGVGGEGLPWS